MSEKSEGRIDKLRHDFEQFKKWEAMRQEDAANSVHTLKERVTALEEEVAELKRRGPVRVNAATP
jgi:polyhydroxyalkanoate synthesis regulator phasin